MGSSVIKTSFISYKEKLDCMQYKTTDSELDYRGITSLSTKPNARVAALGQMSFFFSSYVDSCQYSKLSWLLRLFLIAVHLLAPQPKPARGFTYFVHPRSLFILSLHGHLCKKKLCSNGPVVSTCVNHVSRNLKAEQTAIWVKTKPVMQCKAF